MAEKKTKKKPGILRVIVIALAGLLLGVNIYRLNAEKLGGNQLPMPLGFGTAVVLSGSMEPTLHVNDVIFVRPAENYQAEDIVVYQSQGMLVVHRIRSIDGETVITRGDNNNADDDPISLNAILGKVTFSVPFVGLLVKFLKTPIGIFLIIVAAVLFMELSFSKEKNKGDQELDSIKEEIRRLKAEQTKPAAPENAATEKPTEPEEKKETPAE